MLESIEFGGLGFLVYPDQATGGCRWTALVNGRVTRGSASSTRCAICQVQLAISIMAQGQQPGKETAWH